MARKAVILFASLGRTDLQVVVEKGGRPIRVNVGGGVRAFHHALLEGSIPFQLAREAVALPEGRREDELAWDGAQGRFKPAAVAPVLTDDRRLTLALAKLAPPLEVLR